MLQPLSAPHFLSQFFCYRHKCTKFALVTATCLVFYISLKNPVHNRIKALLIQFNIQVPLSFIHNELVEMNEPLNVGELVLIRFP